jgi:hypothetical protein
VSAVPPAYFPPMAGRRLHLLLLAPLCSFLPRPFRRLTSSAVQLQEASSQLARVSDTEGRSRRMQRVFSHAALPSHELASLNILLSAFDTV